MSPFSGIRFQKNIPIVLGVIILVLAFLPWARLTFFVHPQVDDYGYSLWDNFFIQQKELYFNIGGRYFANAFGTLVPMNNGGFELYRLAIFLFNFAFAATIIFSGIFIGFKIGFTERQFSFLFGILLYFTIMNALPAPNEGLFWYSGFCVYLLPFSILLVWLMLMDKFQFSPPVSTGRLLACMLFLVIGGGEIIMVLCWMVMGLITLFVYRMRWANIKPALPQYAALMMGTAIMVMAPGNQARSQMLTPDYDWVKALQLSVKAWYLQTNAILFNPGFWVLVLVLFFYFLKNPPLRRPSAASWAAWLLFSLGLVCISFPNTFFSGQLPPGRFLNIVYIVQLLSMVWGTALLLQAISYAWHSTAWVKYTNALLWSVLLMGVTGVLKFGYYRYSNYKILADDNRAGLPQQYHRALHERYLQLRQKADSVVVLEPLPTKPRALFVMDIQDNPNEWPNTHYAQYWGKSLVELAK